MGLAPVLARQGFHYYLVLVDDFFRFTWIFALTNKSDALKYLIVFQRLIENQHDRKIKVFQSDHDGEFWALFLITYVGAEYNNASLVLQLLNKMLLQKWIFLDQGRNGKEFWEIFLLMKSCSTKYQITNFYEYLVAFAARFFNHSTKIS